MIENRKNWATYGVELNKIAVINKWKIKGKARGQIKINTQKRQNLWYFFFFCSEEKLQYLATVGRQLDPKGNYKIWNFGTFPMAQAMNNKRFRSFFSLSIN